MDNKYKNKMLEPSFTKYPCNTKTVLCELRIRVHTQLGFNQIHQTVFSQNLPQLCVLDQVSNTDHNFPVIKVDR